jgi:hypothetical protein
MHDVHTDGDNKYKGKESCHQERDPDGEGLVAVDSVDGRRQEGDNNNDAEQEAATLQNGQTHDGWMNKLMMDEEM